MENNQSIYNKQVWIKMRGLPYDASLVEPTKN